MQAKKDKIWMTLGWSFIGNIFGVGTVRFIDQNSEKYKSLRQFKKRELLKAGAFLATVGLFTLWGYGSAQQAYVRAKIRIVEQHIVKVTNK